MHIIRAIHKRKSKGIFLDPKFKTEVTKNCLVLLLMRIKGKSLETFQFLFHISKDRVI
jgi:hypothetical protein